MISTQQIKYILSVDEFGSFSKAAKKLGVTQPTLSMQIKSIETLLDLIIFDREKSPVIPTLMGEKIIKQCRRALKEIEEIHQLRHEEEISGKFTIGVIPTVAPFLIPLFIENIKSQYPKVSLTIVERQTDDLIKDVQMEKIDFGLLATPLKVDDLYETVLYYEPFRFYLNSKNTLLNKTKIKVDELKNETIYQLEDGHCLGHQTQKICSKIIGKIDDNIFIQGGQIQTLINFTNKYGGATLIPELFLETCSPMERKQVIKISGSIPTREISIISSRYFQREDIRNILITEIKSSLPQRILKLKKEKVTIIPIK